jgi:hypothetical protein
VVQGLPKAGAALHEARGTHAVPTQDGDLSILLATVDL